MRNICEKCRKSVSLNDNFCRSCGSKFIQDSQQQYKVTIFRKGREREVVGTLSELENYFGYTLLLAYEEKAIKKKSGFKTANAFIEALEKAYDFKEEHTYNYTRVEIEKV